MKEKKIIYKGNHSGCASGITDFNILGSCSLPEKTKDFIDLAIAFSKRHKADIVIAGEEELRVELYIQVGTFMGSVKNMFASLMAKSKDMLIMSVTDSPWFTLKITLYHMI